MRLTSTCFFNGFLNRIHFSNPFYLSKLKYILNLLKSKFKYTNRTIDALPLTEYQRFWDCYAVRTLYPRPEGRGFTARNR